jgi:hypothetical protein
MNVQIKKPVEQTTFVQSNTKKYGLFNSKNNGMASINKEDQ